MKLITYLLIIAAISLGLNIAGISTPTGLIADIITGNAFGSTGSFYSSPLYIAILAVFALAAAGGGIVIGYFTKTSPESYLIAPIALLFMGFVGDMIAFAVLIHNSSYDWLYLIFSPLIMIFTFGYIIAVIDWWRGVGQ